MLYLPADIFRQILLKMDLQTISRLCVVSTRGRDICNGENFWSLMLKRDYSIQTRVFQNHGLLPALNKQLYKELYINRKNQIYSILDAPNLILKLTEEILLEATKSKPEAFAGLLEKLHINPITFKIKGTSLLYYAIKACNYPLVSWLVREGCEIDKSVLTEFTSQSSLKYVLDGY